MTASRFVVLHDGKKQDLAATEDGFSLYGESEPVRVEWPEVRSATRPDMMSVKFELPHATLIQFAFQSVADRNRFLAVARDGLPGGSDLISGSSSVSPSPKATMRPLDISSYVLSGALLQLIGGLVAGIASGNLTSIDLVTGESSVQGGAVAAMCLGLLAVTAGAYCLLVAVIAKGVHIAMSAVTPR